MAHWNSSIVLAFGKRPGTIRIVGSRSHGIILTLHARLNMDTLRTLAMALQLVSSLRAHRKTSSMHGRALAVLWNS